MKVTIKVERDDGQFAVAVRDLPADLADKQSYREWVTDQIAAKFAELYVEVAGLPS